MAQKIKLSLMLLMFGFILTSCGARVYTDTSLERDGAGKRILYLSVNQEDESKITGGFDRLEEVLKENAPACIKVNRIEKPEERVTVFELTYTFSDMEEFREKTEMVTGKKSDIHWEQGVGAFKGRVSYKDSLPVEDMIQWIKNALEQESVSGVLWSNLYEIEDSKVSYQGEQVWQGKDNASFEIDLTPTIQEVSVYSDYDMHGETKKQIKLTFSYDDYQAMDTEEGLKYLKAFSEKFKVDNTCNGYSVTLKGEKEIRAFFEKASEPLKDKKNLSLLNIDTDGDSCYLQYDLDDNIFSNRFEVKESYNLNVLLDGFHVSAKNIRDYVSLPKTRSYQKEVVHHVYGLESNDEYQFIGSYPIRDDYYSYFSGGDSVTMKSVKVQFIIDEEGDGTQNVTIRLNKNHMDFGNSDVMKYYSEHGQKVSYEESGEDVKIVLIKEFSKDHKEKDGILKKKGVGLSKIHYEFQTDFTIENYIPFQNILVEYTFELPSTYQVQSFSFGDTFLNKKSIKSFEDREKWKYITKSKQDGNILIVCSFTKINTIFYIMFSVLIMVFVGLGLSAYFYWKGKGEKKE